MRSVLATVLAMQVVITGMLGGDLREAGKFDHLMEHFRWHRSQAERPMSFFDFLALHYSDRTHQASDPGHHAQLPFNGPHAAGATNVLVTVHDLTALVVGHVPTMRAPLFAYGREPEFLRGHLDRIFHPPKA